MVEAGGVRVSWVPAGLKLASPRTQLGAKTRVSEWGEALPSLAKTCS